jgi:hypothetical protein
VLSEFCRKDMMMFACWDGVASEGVGGGQGWQSTARAGKQFATACIIILCGRHAHGHMCGARGGRC